MSRWILHVIAGALLALVALPVAATEDPAAVEHFEARVRPLLAKHCWKCHGPAKAESGLRLDTAGGLREGGGSGRVIVQGKPEESLLLRAVRQSGELKMPPGGKLKPEQIEDLARWIRSGAVWPGGGGTPSPDAVSNVTAAHKRHWAFQPVRTGPPPKVKDASWAKSPIDHFILAELEQRGLQPAPAAEKRTLLRRLTFDLTGLPPTPEEIADFDTTVRL